MAKPRNKDKDLEQVADIISANASLENVSEEVIQEPVEKVVEKPVEPLQPEQVAEVYPTAVLMLNNFVMAIAMPGQHASITKIYRDGQTVTNPESIKQLIDAKAPIRALG